MVIDKNGAKFEEEQMRYDWFNTLNSKILKVQLIIFNFRSSKTEWD